MWDGEKRILAVEVLTNHVQPPPPPGGPKGQHRPLGVGLHCVVPTTTGWLTTDQEYDLHHDGVGWVVSSPLWTDGRRYRLFDGVKYVSDLVGAEVGSDNIAVIPLEPQARYRLRFSDSVLSLTRESTASGEDGRA
jgi:hypothetical protein